MKVSYTVDVDEEFSPPSWGLAPSNFDPATHQVMLITARGETESALDWSKCCTYVLRKKKVIKRHFTARTDKSGSVIWYTLEEAWNYMWPTGKATKFVVESVYEDDILIDIIVHKSPPSKE